MKIVAAAAVLLIASLPAQAQINKCRGPDGKVVYQDTTCAGGGEELDIKSRRTDPYSQYESEAQARRDIGAARQLDRDRELRNIQADAERQTKDRERQAKAARCAEYQSRSRYLEARSNTWYTQHYRDQDRAEAKSIDDRHWSECFAGR